MKFPHTITSINFTMAYFYFLTVILAIGINIKEIDQQPQPIFEGHQLLKNQKQHLNKSIP